MTSPSNRPATTTTETTEARTPALDLSFTKIAGGALAAVTTAVAASFLGVSGTLTGAAFGSVVSSVAAALYAASMKHAGTRVRATTRTVITRAPFGSTADSSDPTALPAETMVLPDAAGAAGPDGRAGTSGAALPSRRDVVRSSPNRSFWKPVAVLAGIAFAISLGFITLTEGFLGHPISNSQGSGTSIGTVVGGDAPVAPTKHRKPVESTTTSDSPSESPSDSPTDSPTDGATPTDSVAPGDTTTGPGDQASTSDSTATGQTQGGQVQSQPAATPTGYPPASPAGP
jgi:hypothetical protein